MKTLWISLATLALVSACGGGSGSSSERRDAPPITGANEESYVNFMKTAFSDWAGNNYNVDDSSNDRAFAAAPVVTPAPEAVNSDAGAGGTSSTNVQIGGVDEADSFKYSAGHLLSLETSYNSNTRVRVLSKAMLDGLEQESDDYHLIKAPSDLSYSGILIHDNRAALVGYSYNWYFAAEVSSMPFCLGCSDLQDSRITSTIWQFTDDLGTLVPAPNEVTIEGELVGSRAIENKLYIVSRFRPEPANIIPYPSNIGQRAANQEAIDQLAFTDLTPNITVDGTTSPLVDPANCHIPQPNQEHGEFPVVLSVTVIDMENPSDWVSSCTVGESSEIFVSTSAIYVASGLYDNNEVRIKKFDITDKGIRYAASGTIDGSLGWTFGGNSGSYLFGEHNGNLAVVNTVYDQANWWGWGDGRHQLTILNQPEGSSTLEVVGKIPNEERPEPIGKPGEDIYAVRIIGDRAYVVTFQKVDPLYVIDLADATDPRILGELEIPGYSAYIHPITDNLVLGIGKNAVVEEGTVWYQGLNMRLFDVSDPSQPVVAGSLNYGLRGSNTTVNYNPHAFTSVYNGETGVFSFAIPMSLAGPESAYNPQAPASTFYDLYESGLYQFQVDTNTAFLKEVERFTPQLENDVYFPWNGRSVIDDDSIYYTGCAGEIHVLDWGGSAATRTFASENNCNSGVTF